jgi:hypothetical protein
VADPEEVDGATVTGVALPLLCRPADAANCANADVLAAAKFASNVPNPIPSN